MKDAPDRPPLAWEPFASRGRAYLRATLPDAPGASFAVARTVADRYDAGPIVAVGQATILFRARDLRTGRGVVIKALRTDHLRRLPPGSSPTAEVRRIRHLLQTERRLLVRLRNAGCNNVPNPDDYVYDRNLMLEGLTSEGSLVATEPYLVLQELAGATLEEVLAREFPTGMDERQALRWIAPVVRTLGVLHEPWRLQSGRTWHCVYQDFKPANLIVDPLGRLTLLDFGGCQVVVDGVPVLEGAYTLGYAPPECLTPSARVLLPCADVYTIGSTLHHMLSGVDPRDRREPLDSRSLPRPCSPGVRRLVDDCLASRPSGRLADASRVLQALSTLAEI